MQKDEYIEMSPEGIADIIFNKPPGNLNSVNLQLEQQTAEIASQDGIEIFTSNILQLITIRGIKILFGNISFIDFTGEQVELIKQYTRSYGYNLMASSDEETNQLYVYFERTFV